MKLYKRNILLGTLAGIFCVGLVQADSGEPETASGSRSTLHKIVGGEEATPGEFPFMTSLQLSGFGHYCGASVVADSYVLTASHCTEGKSPSDFKVVAGMHNQNDSSGTQSIQVTKIINHPSYDIALLKLVDKVDDRYTRISLGDDNDVYDGMTTTVIGWGALSEGGGGSSTLQKVDVPVVSLEDCRDAYGNSVTENDICAGLTQGGKDSCQGDSGGPLFFNQAGEFRQLGIVSWGEGCARPGKYGVYTSVPKFKTWILSNIDDGGSDPLPNRLENGVPRTGLAGASGDMMYFILEVPKGATDLSFEISGGSGDADMYVKAGSKPSKSDYDCRPYKNGNNETCADMAVTPGDYFIMLHGYSSYSGVSLVGSYAGGDDGKEGSGKESNLSAARGEWLHFSDRIPEGTRTLTVIISGEGRGDADLYVRQGSKPTDTEYDCRPYKNGNNETCVFDNPAAEEWHMSLKAYSEFSDVTLEWVSE
ncbi:serine protease [Hahella sp. CCB-MM4]|uniref:trypsin-like serine protease n=1 Tax=Hahella sp. (strain CCB-MM4) TaxID=1926491 RepID=UPI000B9C6616|nr:trypsin-like serine protease [Hahella sp. CCB-MM4]OZG70363.1 serine protease [Hahella sp. CCB-MM4]